MAKSTVIIEFRLQGAIIQPDKEQEFLSAFRALGERARQALASKEGIETIVIVSAK